PVLHNPIDCVMTSPPVSPNASSLLRSSTNPFDVFRIYKPTDEEAKAVEKARAAFYMY
ncbi:hypothetical protein HDU93_004021, partial [Gonapodya sp. JEL0774]